MFDSDNGEGGGRRRGKMGEAGERVGKMGEGRREERLYVLNPPFAYTSPLAPFTPFTPSAPIPPS